MSDLRKAISCRDGRGRIGGKPCPEHEAEVVAAARRFLALTETGPDYEAAVDVWEGLYGSKGQAPKPSKVLVELIIDAALADYLTEES